MPKLSPRRLEQTGEVSDVSSVFWRRFEEIKYLIDKFITTDWLITHNLPALRMVVIDSLNVFGDKPVSRYMIEQLFNLFRSNNLVGICVAEDPESAAKMSTDEPYVSTGISNIADVVIKLGTVSEQNYNYRTFEVVKSRHTNNILGPQKMKQRDSGIEVFLTLDCWYTFLSGEPSLSRVAISTQTNRTNFGLYQPKWSEIQNDDALEDDILIQMPSIIHTITGQMNTRKTHVAMRYAKQSSEDVVSTGGKGEFMIITFDISSNLEERAAALGEHDYQTSDLFTGPCFKMQLNKGVFNRVIPKDMLVADQQKCDKHVGYQLWLRPGALLSEELVYFIACALMIHSKITRVIFLDIGQIPTRHTVLAYQICEHANLFVVLIELFRKVGVDACFVCTSNEDADTGGMHHQTPNIQTSHLSKMLESMSHGTLHNERNGSAATVEYTGRFSSSSIRVSVEDLFAKHTASEPDDSAGSAVC